MERKQLERFVSTDLACESGRCAMKDYVSAKYSRREANGTVVETLEVEGEEARGESGKEDGIYVTISDPRIKDASFDSSQISAEVAAELEKLLSATLSRRISSDTKVLVVGLGNRRMTSDALGTMSADRICATSHLLGEFPEFKELGCASVSVTEPGVLSGTGIESALLVKGAAQSVGPHVIIAIDSMAARDSSRLATTVQISNTGISPGGGIGNNRCRIDGASLGCPVISIGSPTVVRSSTLVYDALEAAGITDVSAPLVSILENGIDFFVSPDDCDRIVDRLSQIISYAVNRALGTSDLV
ncbi:MAG: GPR endopeptidase [Clostridia bacterium]|nr:GPR endopeptidase [Clostridia bacterium]